MAAYAAINSVMHILQQIQHHPRPPITIQDKHMDSLCEIITFLQDFLENYSQRDMGGGKEALESRIADAAYAAEDVIESHIVDQILAKSNFHEQSHIVDQIPAKSNFHEQNNFIDIFYRDVKKLIRTLACFRSHKTDQVLTRDRERSSNSLLSQDLQKVIEDMNLIKKEVIEIQENIMKINDDQLPTSNISMSQKIIGSSTVTPPKRKSTNTMVGFDDVLFKIMDRLTGHPPNRQVLPIVGMGGIGKTTLARNVYDNPLIVHHFHIHIWITISQEYRLRDILLEALSSLHNDENKTSEEELGHQLYRSLCGKRYLIILDDMWSIAAWEELMLLFPDNNNGSRIVITTRSSNVSNYFGSCGFKMDFLDEDKSWKLLCKIVFEQDQCCCPPELEVIGKKIAKNCKGLPLSISVIGGLLAKSEKTHQHWEYIAENLNPILNLEDDMYCFKILYLSYNHLPIHLKPCFLYMGIFPEDTEIAVSSLIRLWISEGFLKPIAAKSLEVVAEEYLKDLIDRNLILFHSLGSSGKVKYCKIHDLLRDLCLIEGEKDKFFWVSKVCGFDLEGIQSQRRFRVQKFDYDIDKVILAVPSASLERFLICDFQGVRMTFHSFRFARVFYMGSKYTSMDWYEDYKYSLGDIFKLVNSQYLVFKNTAEPTKLFSSSIQLLWNLQKLIIFIGRHQNIHVPPEIREMSQLRHLEVEAEGGFSLPDPPNIPLIHKGDDDYFILRNLQTIKTVRNLKLSKGVIKRIPNIKKLGLSYDVFVDEEWRHKGRKSWRNYCLDNLGILNKLESLNIIWLYHPQSSSWIKFPSNLVFPHSLKKLTLFGTNLLWEDMRIIGSLPHLQVLKLKQRSFLGPEWNPVEGEFVCLKFLLIQLCDDLEYWNANITHFSCLEQLVLDGLLNLKEIPFDIGQISTLQSIKLFDCRDYVVESAKNILDEQVELGNEDLRVLVMSSKNTQLKMLATHNFQVENF